MTERFFAPCPRGLEAKLGVELAALDAGFVAPVDGGVAFSGPLELVYRANLESRLASRVLWQVAHGACRHEDDLYALARKVRWTELFRVDRTLRVDTAATRSPLRSLEFATLKVKDAVCDAFRDDQGARPSVDKQRPDVRVQAFLTEREATLYVDTSGEPLFKRGYRREADAAPLRENLAAGLLALAGWQPPAPFLDPMCGSGTIAIEAALIAAGRAPGLARTFGFQKLAWYDGPTWQRIRQQARDRVRPDPAAAPLYASDRDPGAVRQALRNAAGAGVAAWLQIEASDVLQRIAPAPQGTLLGNPPYGVRLEGARALEAFYPQLGDALKQHFTGWTAWLMSADLRLPKLIGLKPAARIPLYNGALECRLFRFDMVAGRPRRPSRNDAGPQQAG